jgi:cellulose synthase/poly-beta-1,6-N-acetylglucosamine synthase-like glycosyltransferase
MQVVQVVLLLLYVVPMLFIFGYSLVQFSLMLAYRAKKKTPEAPLPPTPSEWPLVTVQLPIYNERYVVERLLDTVALLDYPATRLEIQILDDSTDDTTERIAERVAYWTAKGVNMQHVRRPNREGFKAGALAWGLAKARGEFIAIFDADFVPSPDFLQKTIPYFLTDAAIGVVQTRWGHLNESYSLITRLQALGLDAHFTIEQTGRSSGGHFINFNGTAGVWRRQTIMQAGGWSADTLTEDLDLSYRAQLNGWRFVYLENLLSPAELPITMPAVKSQQYRWTKGAAECARKNLPAVWRSPRLSLSTKLHATFHLLNSTVFVAALWVALWSVPMMLLTSAAIYLQWTVFFQLSLVMLASFYWMAFRQKGNLGEFIRLFPAFLGVMMGLSFHNAIAVLEGYLGRKTPFVRTPKFNIRSAGERWQTNRYLSQTTPPLTRIEAGLAVYFTIGLVLGITQANVSAVGFHGLLVAGYSYIAYYSIRHSRLS